MTADDPVRRRMAGWLRRGQQAERAVACGAFLALVAVLFADVVSRELTGAGLAWARQVGVYANLLVTMAGLGLASAQGAHLRPRFADRWLPARWDPLVARLQEALMAAFCVGFAVVGLVAATETRTLGENSAMPAWPVWPVQLVIPLAFFAAAARHAAFAAWPELRSRPPDSGREPR